MIFALKFNPEDIVPMTDKILEGIKDVPGISTVGSGLAAVFILFHIASCGISLFQEQKFRLKMLYPFIIFFLVCNFSLVSGPATSVMHSITSTICESLNTRRGDALEVLGRDAETGVESESLSGAIFRRLSMEASDLVGKSYEERMEEVAADKYDAYVRRTEGKNADSGIDPADVNDKAREKEGFLMKMSNVMGGIKAAILDTCDALKYNIFGSLVQDWRQFCMTGFVGVVLVVLQFIMDVMAICMSCFGAVLTGIIVAFGPLTFALACLNDSKMEVILHWFLRLLQYSLWAPIIQLINCLIILACTALYPESGHSYAGNSSLLAAVGLLLAGIVALTQVPTIAGMIIEGVHGNASLSMGMSTVASYLGAPGRLMQTLATLGEPKRDKEQKDLLRDIAHNTGGIGTAGKDSSGTSDPSNGLQTNK